MASKKLWNQPLVEGMESFPKKNQFLEKASNLSHNMRIKRDFLGFKWNERYWVAEITIGHFRPMGLMLWDCPPRTWMKQTLIGNNLQILASWQPVPAELFMMAKSFEQLEKRILQENLEPPGWPDFDSAHIGNLIRVELTDDDGKPVGPPTRVAM